MVCILFLLSIVFDTFRDETVEERMENLKIFGLDIRHGLIFLVTSRLILGEIKERTFNDTAFWPRFRFHGYLLREKLPLFYVIR